MSPRLQHLSPLEVATIASFMTTNDLLHAATASHWCLKAFSPEIDCILLCHSRRVHSQHPHFSTICHDKEGQAAILASLLSRLSGLRELGTECTDVLVWPLATALLASSPYPRLTTLHVHEAGPPCYACMTISCATATVLASAITRGCLNDLQDLGFDDGCFEDGAAAIIFASLASPTTCPNLCSLTFIMGDVKEDGVKVLGQAFTARAATTADSQPLSQPVQLRSLDIGVSRMVGWAGLDDIFRSGVCDELEELILRKDYATTDMQAGLDMVAEYLLSDNNGRPWLQMLDIDLDWGGLGKISTALQLGAAPFLDSLSIKSSSPQATCDLAAAFKAGALSALSTLSFTHRYFTGASMTAIMAGVLSSSQSGASLEELVFDKTLLWDRQLREQVEREVSRALVKGLKDGAFPNLQTLYVCDEEGAILSTNSSIMAFAKAMEEGAPCARILKHVVMGETIGGVSDEVKVELQRVLPGAEICYDCEPE